MSFALSSLLMVLLFAACGIVAGAVQRGVGLLSVAHAAVLGCGAYSYAAVAKLSTSPPLGLAAALIVGALAGASLTVLAARVDEERYALTTFGVQIVWIGLVSNLEAVTGGVLGIPGIPAPAGMLTQLIFAAILACLAAVILMRPRGTAFGAGCAVLGRSRELAATLGIRYVLILLGLGAGYGAVLGVGGAIIAGHLSFIDPTLFATGVSVTILAIAFFVLGNGVFGGLFGAVFIVGVPQAVRLVGVSTATAGYLQFMLSGLALTAATVIWVRGGARS